MKMKTEKWGKIKPKASTKIKRTLTKTNKQDKKWKTQITNIRNERKISV